MLKKSMRFLFCLQRTTFFFTLVWYNTPAIRRKDVKRMLREGEKVKYDVNGDVMTVYICGEIDHHSAVLVRSDIDRQILAQRPKELFLELSSVDFMDSSGLGLIMGRYALIKQFGGSLTVLDPSAAVLKIMKLAGMERIVPIKKAKERKE
jgi:stage II sporulation protein AA (anti-sigma F factor antagonist)